MPADWRYLTPRTALTGAPADSVQIGFRNPRIAANLVANRGTNRSGSPDPVRIPISRCDWRRSWPAPLVMQSLRLSGLSADEERPVSVELLIEVVPMRDPDRFERVCTYEDDLQVAVTTVLLLHPRVGFRSLLGIGELELLDELPDVEVVDEEKVVERHERVLGLSV